MQFLSSLLGGGKGSGGGGGEYGRSTAVTTVTDNTGSGGAASQVDFLPYALGGMFLVVILAIVLIAKHK